METKTNSMKSTQPLMRKKYIIIKIKILRVHHMLLLVSRDSVSQTFQHEVRHFNMKDHGKTAVEVLPTLL